jgi:signal peptidase I
MLLKRIAKIIFIAALCFLTLRLGFVDVFSIPSSSMRDALRENDLIVINKALYSGIFSPVFSGLNWHPATYVNDILVFRLEKDDSTYYTKRCIGLPGNRIRIAGGMIMVNGDRVKDLSTVRHLYRVWHHNFSALADCLGKYGIRTFESEYKRRPGFLIISLSEEQKDHIYREAAVDSIALDRSYLSQRDNNLVAGSGNVDTVVDNYGPLFIPYQGWSIRLDSANWSVYGNIIRDYEDVAIVGHGDSTFYLDGRKVSSYTFRNDYYFMMGDNRDDSYDSRYFGCIPGYLITGKLIYTIH